MKIVICPTFSCNLKCPYCYLNADGTRGTVKKQLIISTTADDWIEGILWLEKEFEEINIIDISGGEPLLYEQIKELIEKIPLRIFLGLTTNLLLANQGLSNISSERKNRIHLIISAHLTEDKILSDEFIENAKQLKKHFSNSIINFVGYHGYRDKIDYIKQISKELGIPLHFEPRIDYSDKPKFAVETLSDNIITKEFSMQDFVSIKRAIRRNIPSECYIGHSYMWIIPNGDIYQCLGQFLAEKKPIGNIFTKKIYERPKKLIVCDLFCPCAQNWRD